MIEEKIYLYWLNYILPVDVKLKRKLLNHFGSAERIFNATSADLSSIIGLTDKKKNEILKAVKNINPEKIWEEFLQSGFSFITINDASYPSSLKEIFDPPLALFVAGKLPCDSDRKIAIVGARNCSEYGQNIAREIGYILGKNEVTVVSGMARGIDSAGHRGALDGNGKTIAVLGCGINVVYPPENGLLYEKIVNNGAVISEVPLNTAPHAGLFPLRNRIISGLCDTVIVVEAKEKSGSLITADLALDQGKDVFAVPGKITDTYSKGCNRLIRQGAGIIVSTDEITSDLKISTPLKTNSKNIPLLTEEELRVYELLDYEPKPLLYLCEKSNLTYLKVLESLTLLDEKCLIKEVFNNNYVLV